MGGAYGGIRRVASWAKDDWRSKLSSLVKLSHEDLVGMRKIENLTDVRQTAIILSSEISICFTIFADIALYNIMKSELFDY